MIRKLILQPTDTSQWYTAINEAQQELSVTLPEPLESYLVFMLIRFTDSTDCLNSVVGKEYLQSNAMMTNQRELMLRDVGDKCLLFSGFFPGQARRRHVKLSYFINIGKSAYASIAHMNQASMELYASLAKDFVSVMDVMQALRQREEQHHLIVPSDAVELWKTYESRVSAEFMADLSAEQINRILGRKN